MRYRIFALLTALPLLLAATARAQHTGDITDLAEFTVKNVKLTPLGIVDSLRKHRTQNYPAFLYYGATMEASISASGTEDTLFYASRPVYLERGEGGRYAVLGRAEDKGRQHLNRATPAQTDRVVTLHNYPGHQSLGEMMDGLRELLRRSKAYYGSSFEHDTLRILHLVVPVNPRPGNFITRLAASGFSQDTMIAYLSMTVDPADWSLREQSWVTLSTDKATADQFRAAKTYTAINRLLEEVLRRKGARFIRTAHSFGPIKGRKGYGPVRNLFEDNLYNLSKQMPKKGENPEASILRLRLLFNGPLAQLPKEDLTEAKTGDFVPSEHEGVVSESD